ncbi:Kinesin-associated protein 3 (KAP-3) (KAP3) (Smg GDS-associated protein) [Durusdinium trenchii]|uniref:Kinesin-associated protein 3 (KAP-3) (KAP3) (Smg GDS-associated protein) n=1 Tax=Durusdinium trenchii TaxID=1381693 RepID=A0ABP0RQE6_9DINO
MHVCLCVLLNLAEEISIEKKMVNRKIPHLLIQLLDRTQEDLLLVVLTFLKKLSVFEENKDQIAVPETLSNLVRLAQHQNQRIALLSLRLLFNLSFDERVRAALVESGIVKLLVDLLKNPPFRHIVLRLLYHFSMDDRCKSLMAYHRDGMIMLLQLVVHFPEPRVGKDLVALMVNLASNARAAEVIVQSGLFPPIMLRVMKHRDPLLCKVIRNVASHSGVLEQMCEVLDTEGVRMAKWMNEFVRMAVCSVDHPDFLVEVLGTLANVTLEEVAWGELCESGLLELLTRLLVPSFSEDDVVLECVLLIGNLASSRDSVQHVAESRLPTMMQDLLVEKREDEEIVVQLLFAFQCLVSHDEVREFVLQETELAPAIMRFARARNPLVLEYTTALLQIVAVASDNQTTEEGVPDWVAQIKGFRFEQHNPEWCRYVNRELSGGTGMSPGAYGGYYDDQGSPRDDEEEFAFHWSARHGY